MLVGLVQAWRIGSCSCWTTWHWSWVLEEYCSSAPSLNHTCREVGVISLATFTIPVCIWIASETDPAVEPSRSQRYRQRLHSDVDRYVTSTTGLTPDSELFTELPAEASRVTGEEVQPRKPSRVRSSTDVTHMSREDKYISKSDAKKKSVGCTSSSTSRFAASRTESPRSHAHRVSGLLKDDETRAEVVGEAGRVGGKEPKTRHGKRLHDGKQGRRTEPKRARPSPARAVFEKFSAVGAGSASGHYPECACCSRHDGDEGVERPEVGGVAGCSLRNVVEVQQWVRPDGWSFRSSSTSVRREQMCAPPSASKTGDGLENEGIRQRRSFLSVTFQFPC